MKEIQLTKGKVTIVDDEDFDFLSQWKWHFKGKGYAYNWKMKSLHRLLLTPPVGKFIDHKNGDKLDNRKSNLRISTISQNMMNSLPRGGSFAGLKGVTADKGGKWRASINLDGRNITLGRFFTKQGAALAYKVISILEYGEFSYASRSMKARASI